MEQNSGKDERVIFVAVQAGKLVGMAGVSRSLLRKVEHGGTVWGVYVRPALRGQRIAQSLVEACPEWAREKGLVILKLGLAVSNLAAIRCYERCGFGLYGVEPNAFYVNGAYYDLMRMVLELR